MSEISGSELLTAIVAIVVLFAVFGALTWIFKTRPSGHPSDAEQYIARLNATAAHQQQIDTEKAEKLRAATTARAAQAARNSPGRTGQSTGFDLEHPPGMAPGPGNPNFDRVMQLINQGNYVGAVRKIRQDTGLGLLQAKRYVDILRGM
ncbi:hypothetical protein ACT3S2_01300 [Arthrobacter sp. AOP36-A1-22]|uniref:hypothetical protein n=1 Tax=unclassified Arthrobacter TaxID=235627 RepID=UPI0040346EED